MKQFDIHGKKINYDAPGQLGANSPKPQKLPFVPRFRQQLDALVSYHDRQGRPNAPLSVTMPQLRTLMNVPKEQREYKVTGLETYRSHLLVVVEPE